MHFEKRQEPIRSKAYWELAPPWHSEFNSIPWSQTVHRIELRERRI